MSLLIVFGTRPEYIKVKPLIEELRRQNVKFYTLFTGQHNDLLKGVEVDFKFEMEFHSYNRLNDIMANVFSLFDLLFMQQEIKNNGSITHVMVQGDTTSALAVALATFHYKRKVIHLEAGLRTHDIQNPWPEETNRQLISRIAEIHLCPTADNYYNLCEEGVNGVVEVVGNTGLDNLKEHLDKIEYGNKVLVTLHRRENHDDMGTWFHLVNEEAKKYPELEFIWPLHPNPAVLKHKDVLTHVKVIDPLPHDQLIKLLVKCKFVISDSGGIQEECAFFTKKVIVCRKETERPEALGNTSFLCKFPEDLRHLVSKINEKPVPDTTFCPFGDGFASDRIVKLLRKYNVIS
jgi:UDP-N-acetylglucosamine 2-epimerase (non-hydrolysing)